VTILKSNPSLLQKLRAIKHIGQRYD